MQQPQSDSDSDFECLKKRTKKQVPEKESSTSTTSVNNASHALRQDIHEDHCYAKDSTDPTDVANNSQIPQPTNALNIKNFLQSALQVHLRLVFYVRLSVGNITSKEEVDQWLHQFAASSNIKYNAKDGYKRKGVKVVYARWYIC